MKFRTLIKTTLLLCILLIQLAPALAFFHGSSSITLASLANSQLNPQVGEDMFINALKNGQSWVCTTGGAHAQPSDLDANGYPISTSGCLTGGAGFEVPAIGTVSQFERSGNWVQLGAGLGAAFLFDQNSTTSASPGASSCTGTRSGNGNIVCTNSACTQPTGQISGQTLTITMASTCSLSLYQAITNGSTFTNQFGVPTMVIGLSGSANCPSCTGTGATGTYLVNWSQTVASGVMVQGMYNEISAGTETAVGRVQWAFGINSTNATNPLKSMALVHKNDLLAYAQGQLHGVLFGQRVNQANYAMLRDLGYGNGNVVNTTTWATRKPAGYYSYGASEMRASLFACSYGFYNGTTPCQTSYALNGSSNDYSVNIGSALPVDKQTVCVQYSTTTTNSTVTFSIDNGVTKHTMVAYHDGGLGSGSIVAGHMDGLVYDAATQLWFTAVVSGVADACLQNYGSPEAFVQVNQEIGTTPSIVEPAYASDPITDFMPQYALLMSGFSWNKTPTFSIPDEPWNCAGQGVGPYASVKSRAYIAADATWAANTSGHAFCGSGGDIQNWAGKAASLLGQAIRNISNSYIVLVGVQTVGNGASAWNAEVRSQSYVGQNPSNIATQSGCAGPGAIQTNCPTPFGQTAAYVAMRGATPAAAGIEIANYWNLQDQGTTNGLAAELVLGYCYFFQSVGCASQASTMSTYMATESITNAGATPSIVTLWSNWFTFAQACGGGVSCSPMSIYNYEGTYNISALQTDTFVSNPSVTNGATTILGISPNGCVAGQSVGLSGTGGGAGWSTAGGSYIVQASGTDSAHCAINLNSSAFGTLGGATATASASWVLNAATINVGACPTISGGSVFVTDTTNGLSPGIASGCSGGVLTFPGTAQHSGSSGDTLSFSAVFTYTGSANYVTYLRLNSYLAPDLDTYTTLLYNTIASTTAASACFPAQCSFFPSQFLLQGSSSGAGLTPWFVWSPDLYGYFQVASTSSASATGGNLTLGGTVTGIFTSGLTIVGGTISGATITGACSQTGSLPAGANSGDVCPISSAATISSKTLIGTVAPTANQAGNSTTSPVRQWGAECRWNGNGNQCNGWLLKRDIDPGSNDDEPMWLENVA